MRHKAFIIAGPTASGKSDFAERLARRANGVIINCDSVQIYQGIETISASPLTPCASHLTTIPHKLFSILPLTEQISVAEYLKLARAEYDAAIAAGKTPVFVGGTGFYIAALLCGISPIPEVSEETRTRARDMVRDNPDAARELAQDAARLDPQRLARALEVFLETGRPLSEWQKLPRVGVLNPAPYKVLINPPKDVLQERIAARVSKMMTGGAIEEAREIIATGGDASRAIGAEELVKFINGETDKKTAIENWTVRTNQYAKRQRTWFRTQYAADMEINHVPTEKDLEKINV
ncbi:MAG: tRNA (adenosine(37)-N6)-dimethylallyltransferase MiaA [Alphaproteobacteria bacterium]|nr:tRNA (adenosine(37)-N6)-dimethylallyltransferase MiaA [Alphaproteobacteria bacterium]MCL2758549.1 tRNA (adenosine(37)-N6)-dimethylallyltransferase MiaA [Alphaproteobacteria bacterium]